MGENCSNVCYYAGIPLLEGPCISFHSMYIMAHWAQQPMTGALEIPGVEISADREFSY